MMSKISWLSIFCIWVISIFIGSILPHHVSAATSPVLIDSAGYSVLAGSTVTCTGATTITGDVGVSTGTSITGFPVPCVASPGTIQSNTPSAINAQADNLSAFGYLDQGCDQSFGAVDLSTTFPAGVGQAFTVLQALSQLVAI